MSGSSISPQSCSVYIVETMQSCTMSISTGHAIPLFCTTISIDYHSRYCRLICIILSLIIQTRVQYLTYHIIKLNTLKMKSLRSWAEIDWTWQSLCRLPREITSQNQERIGCAVSNCLTQKSIVARIFKIQVWRATSAHKYGCPTIISGNPGQSGQWSC